MSTAVTPYTRLITGAGSTNSAWAAKVPTATKPTSQLVRNNKGQGPNNLLLKLIGTNAADETFDVRLYGWNPLGPSNNATLWEPILLAELAVTLGSIAREGETTSFDADTLSITEGLTDVVKVANHAGDLSAYAIIDHTGSELIEAEFKVGTATAANLLYREF